MFLFFLSCKDQGTKSEFKEVEKLNQGTIRQRDVIDGGPLFCLLFWGSQKGRRKKERKWK